MAKMKTKRESFPGFGMLLGRKSRSKVQKRRKYVQWSLGYYTYRGLTFEKVPSEWLQTDIREGLSDGDIETRRQGYGYNELSR
jgi:hypothetical protein